MVLIMTESGAIDAPKPKKSACPKCHSEHLIVADQKDDVRGVANNDRGHARSAGHYRKVILRCLDCNHRWAEYYA